MFLSIFVSVALFLGLIPGGNSTTNFQKMFPDLPRDDPSTDQAILDLTRSGGPMQDPNADADNNCDDGTLLLNCTPAGRTYTGQFLDHDVTRDVAPLPNRDVDPTTLPNVRTAAIDLDSVYGLGPQGSPELYEADRVHFRVGNAGRDLPRNPDGTAIIGDPRNDENQVIAQLHVAFLRLHNYFADQHPVNRLPAFLRFAAARATTIAHWQATLMTDFLPSVLGQARVDEAVATAPRYWDPGSKTAPAMPAEFANACWRVGHSQVRLAYRLGPTNDLASANLQAFNGTNNDLHGGRPIDPARFINWPNFFPFPDQNPPINAGRKIDALLSRGLFQLPIPSAISGGPASLAERNLVRAKFYGTPSYQAVARAVGVEPYTNAQMGLGEGHGAEAPLWFGMLYESGQAGGRVIGPTCGIVIADVVVGLIKNQPTGLVPARLVGQVTMSDLLTMAGVGPAAS